MIGPGVSVPRPTATILIAWSDPLTWRAASRGSGPLLEAKSETITNRAIRFELICSALLASRIAAPSLVSSPWGLG